MMKIKENEKEGGILPFLPLILGGIAGLGSLLGGASSIAKTVLDKQNNDNKLEEEKRSNIERENILRESSLEQGSKKESSGLSGLYLNPWKGNRINIFVKDFASKTKLDPIGQKTLRAFLKNLNSNIKIEKQGEGIFLNPYF